MIKAGTVAWFAQHETRLAWRDWAWLLSGGRRIEVHPDFDTNTFERLVGILERA